MVRIAVAVLSLSFFVGQAHASTGMSRDDQWACEVAMCMSNPAGPTAVAECAAPIKKLHEQLAKGKPLPKCKFLSGSNGGSTGGSGSRGDSDVAAQQAQ